MEFWASVKHLQGCSSSAPGVSLVHQSPAGYGDTESCATMCLITLLTCNTPAPLNHLCSQITSSELMLACHPTQPCLPATADSALLAFGAYKCSDTDWYRQVRRRTPPHGQRVQKCDGVKQCSKGGLPIVRRVRAMHSSRLRDLDLAPGAEEHAGSVSI